MRRGFSFFGRIRTIFLRPISPLNRGLRFEISHFPLLVCSHWLADGVL